MYSLKVVDYSGEAREVYVCEKKHTLRRHGDSADDSKSQSAHENSV